MMSRKAAKDRGPGTSTVSLHGMFLSVPRNSERVIIPLSRVALMIGKRDKEDNLCELKLFYAGEEFTLKANSGISLTTVVNSYKNAYYVMEFPQTPEDTLPLILFQSLFLEKCIIGFPKITLSLLCGSGDVLNYALTFHDEHSFNYVVGQLVKQFEELSIFQRK